MTTTADAPRPTEIKLKKAERTLTVAFDNGEAYTLPAEYLRVESPSAEVQGHSPEQKRIVAVRNGSFHIDNLPACALHARASTPLRTEHVRVDITANGIQPLTLDLRQAELKTVRGIVRDTISSSFTRPFM